MIYEMPTKIIFGKGCIGEQKEEFKNLGSKACIVTGKSSAKRNGSYADVVKALDSLGIEHILFDEVEENPSLETLEKAKIKALEHGSNFVIGIGGGSPMDAAKGIAIMIKNPEIGADNLIGNHILDGVPVVAIPTTAGTGSEVTQYAIFTDFKRGTKLNYGHKIFPTIAFLDASYMNDMPLPLTRYTALDALSHLMESYLNVRSNLISETFVQQGLGYFAKCINALVSGEITEQNREELLLASTYGGIAIAQTRTSLPHAMGYSLTYYHNMPHGVANAILYEAYLKSFEDKTRISKIIEWLCLDSLEQLFDIINKLLEGVNFVCSDEELHKYVNSIISDKMKTSSHPEKVDAQLLFDIYKNSLTIGDSFYE
ncbi:MAG: hypothetical protein ATN36_00280 [Epulopiscium sp. Nele67-Bin005]|nr:MAG: hypothetical protein ATN36_00280 [Epulopiscium sp. Nele67-Bin005]